MGTASPACATPAMKPTGPADAVNTFKVRGGFTLQAVAHEPQVERLTRCVFVPMVGREGFAGGRKLDEQREKSTLFRAARRRWR